MERTVFAITCLTCQARLNVRSEAAIGQILTCPKCGSMVEVAPPAGWRAKGDSGPAPKPAASKAESQPAASEGKPRPAVARGKPAASSAKSKPETAEKALEKASKKTPQRAEGARRAAAIAAASLPAAAQAASDPLASTQAPKPTQSVGAGDTATPPEVGSTATQSPSSSPSSTHPAKPTTPAEPVPPDAVTANPQEAGASGGPEAVWGLTPDAVAPAELLWRKWLLWTTTPIAGLVVAFTAWTYLSSRGPETPPAPVPAAPAEPVAVAEKPAPEEPAEPTGAEAMRLDPRWLPGGTRMLVSLRTSKLAGRKELGALTPLTDAWRAVDAVVAAFGLKLDRIRRLSLASTDLAAWPEPGLIVVELEEGQDATVFRRVGEPAGFDLDGEPCRRLARERWPHPFVVLDELTMITGREELLRELADRSEPVLESVPVDRLFKRMTPDADGLVILDLAAAREAGWKLPSGVLDVWPAGREGWHVVWEVPRGLGVSIHDVETGMSEAALLCEGETAAQSVRAALDELIPAAKTAVGAQLASLDQAAADQIVTNPYEVLLTGAATALATARWEVVDETVWLRVNWGTGGPDVAVAAAQSRPAIRHAWLDAALAADQANHERLLAGLDGYRRTEGHFPAGAGGGDLLAPDTRLSWIATMLPYYGHEGWQKELDFAYSWNAPTNRPVVQRRLDEVVNPALGPGRTEAGFPVTHYVGVAGVGPDAGTLPAGHPRAGLFGFNRNTRLDDIPDGASNTIALLGVAKNIGAWAQGGPPTVRALTAPPYVNGPDGFGSGQPDGMLVGMADGSVRFVSKDIDPLVLEQLATIGGGEPATVAALEPARTAKPPEKREAAPPKPEEVAHEPAPSPAAGQPEPAPASPQPPPVAQEAAQPEVDVEARLADHVVEIGLPGVPLADAIDLVAQLSGLRISFDLDAMAELGVSVRDPVTVELADAPVTKVLDAVLATRGLTAVVDHGQLLITSPAQKRNSLRTVSYTVSDMAGATPDGVAELARLIQDVIVPYSWRAAGGRGTIEAGAGALNVTQTDAVHYRILMFCEKLRSARGLPLRSRYDPAEFSLATRPDRARAKLDQPITANFHEPASLVRILSDFEQLSGTRILVDWLALGPPGISPDTMISSTAEQLPLSEALEELLEPLGLAYRVVDGETLQVTARKVLLARLELEFYPIGDLLGGGMDAATLTGKIQDEVAEATWSSAEGPGVIRYDEASKCLIVLQSQPVHFELEALLSKWRAAKKAPAAAPR